MFTNSTQPTRSDLQNEVDDTFDTLYGTNVVDAICDFKEKAESLFQVGFHNQGRGYNLSTILKYHSDKYEDVKHRVMGMKR